MMTPSKRISPVPLSKFKRNSFEFQIQTKFLFEFSNPKTLNSNEIRLKKKGMVITDTRALFYRHVEIDMSKIDIARCRKIDIYINGNPKEFENRHR